MRACITRRRSLTHGVPPEIVQVVEAALDKKAEDLIVLDLHGLSDVTDYFIICHGSTQRQVRALAEAVEERLRSELGCRPSHLEGLRTGDWVLMDYVDFVVHVFQKDRRTFYRLERLWGDAPRVELPSPAAS